MPRSDADEKLQVHRVEAEQPRHNDEALLAAIGGTAATPAGRGNTQADACRE